MKDYPHCGPHLGAALGPTSRPLLIVATVLTLGTGLAATLRFFERSTSRANRISPPDRCRIDVPIGGQSRRSHTVAFDIQGPDLPPSIAVDSNVRIPMRDGVSLAATVFRPVGGERVPVLMAMTPYGRDNGSNWSQFHPNRCSRPFDTGTVHIHSGLSFEAPDPGYWVPRGYAVVLVDDPGTGDSGASLFTAGPEQRWYDTIDWIAQQPWCTGSVAVGGTSFLAIRTYSAGICGHPALKAIMSWEGFNVTGRGAGFGGIPEIAFVPFVISFMSISPLALPEVLMKTRLDSAVGGPMVADMDLTKITVPTLLCASFSDQELHSFDSFEAWSRIRTRPEHKWLYNHRKHKWAQEYGTDALAVQERFLDRYLKGGNAVPMPSHVRLEISETRDESRILHTSDWPVPGTRDVPLFLDACTLGLSERVPEKDAISRWFSPRSPRNFTNRVAFDYQFNHDIDLVGYMALRLWVEIRGFIDSDLFIGVEKLDRCGDIVYLRSSSGGNPNGPVTRGWQRVSRRAIDNTWSTPSKPIRDRSARPRPIAPGTPVQLDIALMPSGTRFLRGETLRLVVQSWPGWDDAGEKRTWATPPLGRTRILTGPGHQSRLLVPALT